MRLRPLARRLTPWLVGAALLAASAGSAGCGGGKTTLGVKLAIAPGQGFSVGSAKAASTPQIPPGSVVEFVITVTNTGYGTTAGVTVRANLPAQFRYKDTLSLGGTAVRTQPVDAESNSAEPEWGTWNMVNHGDSVEVDFDAVAAGDGGSYTMTATASGTSTAGDIQSPGLDLALIEAPVLSMSVAATPSSVQPGAEVTYTVNVFNGGNGPAAAVALLVTLPPVFVFDSTISISGAARSNGSDPVEGTELPYWDGFTIPPRSGTAPGRLEIVFIADVLTDAGALGTYPLGAQVIADQNTERVVIPDTAPVVVSNS
jgi:uncharacterized repeat protein (TIGR01451 family)